MITVYRIDDGNTFEGDSEQFANCFFSNVSDEEVIDFCKSKSGLNGAKLEIFHYKSQDDYKNNHKFYEFKGNKK